jgi:hypothetical protein
MSPQAGSPRYCRQFRPMAEDYAIPYTLGRGYASLPPRYEMAQRFKRTGKDKLVLLVVSDFDCEGEDIGHSFARSMRDDFHIRNIAYIKVALTADQVRDMNLPRGAKAKKGSSRRKGFVEKHGEFVFELEALEPHQLQTMLRQTIEGVLDMKLFRAEQKQEKEDVAYLARVRQQAYRLFGELGMEGKT